MRPASSRPPARRVPLLLLLVAAGAVGYLTRADGHAAAVTYDGLTLAAAALAWWGVTRSRGVRRAPLALLALGLTLSGVADVIYSALAWTSEPAAEISIADAFWIASYLALAAGVLCLIVSDGDKRRWDADVLIDLVAMLVLSFMVIWETTLQHRLADGSIPVLDRLVLAAYPVLDAALLVLAARMVIGRRERSPAGIALTGGLGLWLGSDFVYMFSAGATSVWLDAGWVVGALLMGAAVVAFSAPRQPVVSQAPRTSAANARRIMLAIAPLLLPGAFEILAYLRGVDTNPVPLYLCTAILAGLAFVRAFRLGQRAESAHRAVVAQEQHYRALVANSADAVLVVDRRGVVVSSSGNLEGLIGPMRGPVEGVNALDVLRPSDVDEAEAVFDGTVATPGIVFNTEVQVRHADGGRRWLAARTVNLLHEPAVQGIVINLHDVTDRKEVEDELAHQAFHDSLTGLPNRALFADRSEQALRRSARTAWDPAVLYADLDGFKKINDSLGHAVGDAVLQEIGVRLAAAVRTGDTVGRLGGDEFAVLLEGGLEPINDAAHATADRILAAVRAPLDVSGHQVRLSASIGICLADGVTSTSDLLRNADLAMYQAKSRGKDQSAMYEPDMSATAVLRLELEADLAGAVSRDELTLVYQPVVELGTEAVVGFEALVRWQHPTLGLVQPNSFIPIAEHNGAIIEIGEWVLNEACATAARWQAKQPALHMAVNVSGRQLGSPDIVPAVARALERSGLPASSLVLEITETSLVIEPIVAAERLDQLRTLGIRLAIDDFGTGYSSLNYLRQFKVDILKIDRSFVDTINQTDEVPALVRGLLALGSTLGVEVVAEGIEDATQHRLLQGEQCQYGQGFLFARPLSAGDAETLIDDQQLARASAAPTTG